MKPWISLALAASVLTGSAATVKVGPGERFAKPSQAAAAVRDGDVVEITAGTYAGDVCRWAANRLDIRGAGPKSSILDAAGRSCQGKGTWIVAGSDIRISGLAFRNATCKDRNGAGIRMEGGNLAVSNCLFEANENGILTGALPESELRVTDSVFRGNGAGDGYSHNIYVGKIRLFEFRNCTSDHAKVGHNLKSRALKSVVTECVFDDADDGRSSHLANFPNGGDVTLANCRFVQSPVANNSTMVSVGEEGPYPGSTFSERGNSFSSRRHASTTLRLAPGISRPAALK
jgi:hypothetical protein